MNKTVLGIDFGLKRIGLAFSQDGLVQPIRVLVAKNKDWFLKSNSKIYNQISDTCRKLEVEIIVIGRMEGKVKPKVKIFANEIKKCLSQDGVWIFEQAYLGFILNRVTIDTVLSEHLLYYDLQSIDYILKNAGLKIISVELNDINAGSIRVVAAREDSSLESCKTVDLIKNYEKVMGFNDSGFSIYKNFVTLCINFKREFTNFLSEAKTSGKTVSALGASTKFNCILQFVGASPLYINQIGEVNPDKFGKVTPGTAIPIVPEDDVLKNNPDYIIIGCYHFKDFFLGLPKIQEYIKNGGTVVFPLPTLEFYSA